MIDKIAIQDAAGRHVGVVTPLMPLQDSDDFLFGWTVSDPDNHVRSRIGRSKGEAQAVEDAVAAARELGVKGPHRMVEVAADVAPALR